MISLRLWLILLSCALTLFCAVRRNALSLQTSRRIVLGAAVLIFCALLVPPNELRVEFIAVPASALMWIYFCKPPEETG